MSRYRLDQQQARVKYIISHLIQNEIKDPRLGMVSVTGVEMTRDLSLCKVFVSVLGNEQDIEDSMKALNSSAAFMRKQLAQRAQLRRTPTLEFIYDDSLIYGAKIDKLIREALEDEKK